MDTGFNIYTLLTIWIYLALAVSVWVMLGKIAWLAAMEGQSHNQFGLEHITFDGRDERTVFQVVGPLMFLVIMLMAIVYKIRCIIYPIFMWIGIVVSEFINKVRKEYVKINMEYENRWDR